MSIDINAGVLVAVDTADAWTLLIDQPASKVGWVKGTILNLNAATAHIQIATIHAADVPVDPLNLPAALDLRVRDKVSISTDTSIALGAPNAIILGPEDLLYITSSVADINVHTDNLLEASA